MTAEKEPSTAAPAAELLARRASLDAAPNGLVRGRLRRLLLRALRPYTYHHDLLDREIVSALQRQEAMLEHERIRSGERLDRLERIGTELIRTAESLRRASVDAGSRADAARESVTKLADELRELPYVEGEPFATFDAPVGEVLGFRASAAGQGGGEDAYAEFEDAFRGTAERVRESQRPYLPLLRDHQPVLDIGCGRGELLELLAKNDIAASGVDNDAGMVERCAMLGVDAVLADANEHLAGLADGSLGTIFSAQVIEHFPYDELQRLLRLARRKLRPGGLLIAETVNPHRLASLKTFWVDLTHQHPIFPEVALALCGIAGFSSAYVFAPGFESIVQSRFEAPSYAVVATNGEDTTA
ncbi:MAG TPA: methyltransferase domain-containing protein [Solirubrobacteraceae bacterium]|nr:methyltransferase domain-containing protein [Solirubrobacteraceae bacterium]